MMAKNHHSNHNLQSSLKISEPVGPPVPYLPPEHSPTSLRNKPEQAASSKKSKGLSQFIRGKSDHRPRVQTMGHVINSNSRIPTRSHLPMANSRPETLSHSPIAFKARREERQSHWRVPTLESRLRPQPSATRLAPPEKLELPFVAGCHHIGSRFSINTLMRAVDEVVPKTQDGFHLPHREKYLEAPNEDRMSAYPKIKGPYQPRSLLTRTRQAYRHENTGSSALSRRGSEEGYESAYSDDSPPSLDSNDGSVKTELSSEEDDYQYLNSGLYSHLKPVKEEEEDESALANNFENWVLDALQSPNRFNQPSPSSEAVNRRSKGWPCLKKPVEIDCFKASIQSSLQASSAPAGNFSASGFSTQDSDAPRPTTPLTIRKSCLKVPQCFAASHLLAPPLNSQTFPATGLAKTSPGQDQKPTTGPPVLVTQPWARARNQKPRPIGTKPQLQPSEASVTGQYRLLTPSFVPLSSPRRPFLEPTGKNMGRNMISTSGSRVTMIMSPLPLDDRQYEHSFETPRPAPPRPPQK
ncbi:hypothetical protein CROQUDRAFT_135864 [Cronartium quercuum f. sp. fusiforme G11]|uniref:Uncharacterized protein n=1 Tax=Cronartium quercuum f. sp. fusiforme G11 TaxID=708437 RepID=A0A9P6NDW6_9BASI|nr:hypothetical protein CROQUDRAFT_135864 [Cronartium quercuum f. sp. fusiforme G11]